MLTARRQSLFSGQHLRCTHDLGSTPCAKPLPEAGHCPSELCAFLGRARSHGHSSPLSPADESWHQELQV